MALKFRVELVWKSDKPGEDSTVYLTSDGRVVLEGRPVPPEERERLDLPREAALISVDKTLISAIKEML